MPEQRPLSAAEVVRQKMPGQAALDFGSPSGPKHTTGSSSTISWDLIDADGATVGNVTILSDATNWKRAKPGRTIQTRRS